MDQFFDEAARILAGPLPRRQAMKRLSGLLFAGLLAAFGSTEVAAQTCSPGCPSGQKCCAGAISASVRGAKNFCIPATSTCCGNQGCTATQFCCTTTAVPFCRNAGTTCCGSTSCSSTQTCCNNLTCCAANQSCVNGLCQASNA